MDYSRALLAPFLPTSLLLVAVFSLLISFCLWGGLYGLIAAFLLHVWVLKYCYVLIEHLADGAEQPPVMDMDMLSPWETRPWAQALLFLGGYSLCAFLGGEKGLALAGVLLALFPASAALLGMGDNVFQAVNPLKLFRVIRGLGPLYLLLLAALFAIVGLFYTLQQVQLWSALEIALLLTCEIGFFGLIGSCIWLRRQALGFEPSRSPERAAARAELERVKERARMMDEVFQNARMGKHVDATAPLARWFRDLDADYAARDALYAAEQALKWELPLALNPIGSTLIRHLLRFGRPDAALSVFVTFRERSARFTMDSASDLRVLAEYAEGVGKEELAASMRLETPVVGPPA